MVIVSKYFSLLLLYHLNPVFGAIPPASSHPISTASTPDVDYGEMYVIQKNQTAEKKWQTNLSYSYGFSNPYISIHGVQLGANYNLSPFVSIGISPSFYTTTDKNLAAEFRSQLKAQGIQTQIYQPQHAAYLLLGINPLFGMLNWFHLSPVNFDLSLGAGVGYVKYIQQSNLLPSFRFFVTPEVMLSKTFGLTAGIQLTLDRFSASDWQNRMDALLGWLARF